MQEFVFFFYLHPIAGAYQIVLDSKASFYELSLCPEEPPEPAADPFPQPVHLFPRFPSYNIDWPVVKMFSTEFRPLSPSHLRLQMMTVYRIAKENGHFASGEKSVCEEAPFDYVISIVRY